MGLRIGNLDFANRSSFIFSSFEIVSFSIFSVYCTFCILLVFNGLNRPGLKPYAGRDHPDFGLRIGNLDSANRFYFYFFLHLRLFFLLFLVCTVHCASSWVSMVLIDLGSRLMQEEIILILVSSSATWILCKHEKDMH